MAQSKIQFDIRYLVQRHAVCEGTVLGTKAMESMKKLTTRDDLQHYFQVGDQFTIPGQELLEEFSFVIDVNGRKIPAVAVQCTSGEPKRLCLPTLIKQVVEYEESNGEYRIKKNTDGTCVTHFADTPLRREILAKNTVADILYALSGRTFRVSSIMGPYKTSRLKKTYDYLGQIKIEIAELQETTIPVFEEIFPDYEMYIDEDNNDHIKTTVSIGYTDLLYLKLCQTLCGQNYKSKIVTTKSNEEIFNGKVASYKWSHWDANYHTDDFEIESGIKKFDERGHIIYEEYNGNMEDVRYDYNNKDLLVLYKCNDCHKQFVYLNDGKLLESIRCDKDDNFISRVLYEYDNNRVSKCQVYGKEGIENEIIFIYNRGLLMQKEDKKALIEYKYDIYGNLIEERYTGKITYELQYVKKYKYSDKNLLVETITKTPACCERVEYSYDTIKRIQEEFHYRKNYIENVEEGWLHVIKEFDRIGNCIKEIHNSFDDKKLFSKILREIEYYDGEQTPMVLSFQTLL